MNLDADQTVTQLAQLREQLEEVEQMRSAIVSGEVDAFVVGREEENKRVLMLSGAYMRYRQLVEDMQQGAVTMSKAGEILFVNQSFAAMLRRRPIDLFRTPFEEHVAKADLGKMPALLRPRPGQSDVELRFIAKDSGTPARMSLVSASDDFITYLVTEMARPLSEDEATETLSAIAAGSVDALIQDGQVLMLDSAQRLYQTAVDRMQQGAVMLSAGQTIGYVNERFATLAAAPRARILGERLLKFVAAPEREAFAQALKGCSATPTEVNVRLERGNGSDISLVATLFAIADGRCMCLFTDTSERRRHLEADERNRAFLGMLGHEMRNMLGPMRNSVQRMQQLGLGDDAQEALGIIERQSARMLELVEELRRINPR